MGAPLFYGAHYTVRDFMSRYGTLRYRRYVFRYALIFARSSNSVRNIARCVHYRKLLSEEDRREFDRDCDILRGLFQDWGAASNRRQCNFNADDPDQYCTGDDFDPNRIASSDDSDFEEDEEGPEEGQANADVGISADGSGFLDRTLG